MSGDYSEAEWEGFALEALEELGWQPVEGKRIAPGSGERESWQDLVLRDRLTRAVAHLNPELPASAVDEAIAILVTATSRDAKAENRQVHEYLTKGIRKVIHTDSSGAERNPTIRVIGTDPAGND